MAAVRAYVGLGANIGEPEQQLRQALQALGGIPGTRLVRASSLYRSPPAGYAAQPDFLNAVAEIATLLEPKPLLGELLALEQRFGRTRTFPNAPRTLDLDLLLYGERVIDEANLAVPHPRMRERAFVLAPLAEIAPDLTIPGQGSVADLLARCAGQKVEKLG
jgi:2-amino-4-hydroxy-6-hydroxymethyldihydropteridine diphosphokinase